MGDSLKAQIARSSENARIARDNRDYFSLGMAYSENPLMQMSGLGDLAVFGTLGKFGKLAPNSTGQYLGSRVFVGQEVDNLFGQGGAVINGKVIRTVPADVSARFQGMGYLDPISNTFKSAPLNKTMAVDHIYPVKEIMNLPRFNKLTTEQQMSIIHDRMEIGNFQPLPKTFNSSKGSKLDWATYRKSNLNPVYEQSLIDTQIDIERAIQRQINEFYKSNKGKK